MYPDVVEAVRHEGGPEAARDMLRGAEAYLQTWERAVGVPFRRCQSDRERFTRRGLGLLRLGADDVTALQTAGQPRKRAARRWTYCVRGTRNQDARIVAALDRRGHVALVASTAIGNHIRGVQTGDRAAAARRGSRPLGRGVRVRTVRGARFVYGLRKGRVSFTAVATRQATRSRKALRRHLKLARLR